MNLASTLFDQSPKPRESPVGCSTYAPEIEGTVDLPSFTAVSKDFAAVLGRRRTTYGLGCLSIEQLSNLLWMSARTTEAFAEQPQRLEHRPSLAAGAIHAVQIFVQDVTGLGKKLHWYDAHAHILGTISDTNTLCKELRREANACLRLEAGTVFWFGGDVAAKSAKYEHPDTLLLRDAGALLQTMALTCGCLSLPCAPIGVLGTNWISQIPGERQLVGLGALSVSASPA